ncbi:hypothetical protein JOF29_003013 [Kribbella aluminosa]|uniref:Uncharacterized protein n=1 Tax=Kribbella aluminosa TaxID=416017 RepID=A0ABS4UJY8_9ACTN|nr:hypothetical protein [Kribbella aluminosa]MBP2351930.1 hypothetical protein [Kribbella aluminosa]
MSDKDGDDDEIFAYRIIGPDDAGDEGEIFTVRGAHSLSGARVGSWLADHEGALRIDVQVPEGADVAEEDLGAVAEANEVTIRIFVDGKLQAEYTGETEASP